MAARDAAERRHTDSIGSDPSRAAYGWLEAKQPVREIMDTNTNMAQAETGPADPVPGDVAPTSRRPLKVGVLVDLALTRDAGGHVKCWQRFAEAAVDCADRLDLTVHFNGPEPRRIELSPSVRYTLLPPVFSTARLIRSVPDHTDLAPWHPRMARALADYDVIHTTDAFFCYAQTAVRFARRHGVPVVSSIHTNTPEYARITMIKLLERVLGSGRAYRAATNRLGLPDRVGDLLERRLAKHLAAATSVFDGFAEAARSGANDTDWPGRSGAVRLRRGLDRALFSAQQRDRAWFEQRFALPADRFVLLYAGKLDTGKNVPLFVPMIQAARDAGVPVHLLLAGAGGERAALEAALGPTLTCAGPLGQDELARAYASADLFLFPSVIDEFGNAAVEALASGLPTLLAGGSGAALWLRDCEGLLMLPGDDPASWAAAIGALAADPERRAAMARAALSFIEARMPSWREVLEQDLLPVWQAAAGTRR
jgi:glycosyltransferase involved in cell wall biosynthesis